MSQKKVPTNELLSDLAAVFKKHNLSPKPSGDQPGAMTAGEDADCPPGTYPAYDHYVNAAGQTVTVRYCKEI